MHRLDRVPPAKAKADYYAANESRMLADWGEPVAARPGQPGQTHELRCARNPGRFRWTRDREYARHTPPDETTALRSAALASTRAARDVLSGGGCITRSGPAGWPCTPYRWALDVVTTAVGRSLRVPWLLSSAVPSSVDGHLRRRPAGFRGRPASTSSAPPAVDKCDQLLAGLLREAS